MMLTKIDQLSPSEHPNHDAKRAVAHINMPIHDDSMSALCYTFSKSHLRTEACILLMSICKPKGNVLLQSFQNPSERNIGRAMFQSDSTPAPRFYQHKFFHGVIHKPGDRSSCPIYDSGL